MQTLLPQLRFKICNVWEYNAVLTTLRRAGFKQMKSNSKYWNLLWGLHLDAKSYANVKWWQRCNHFPG